MNKIDLEALKSHSHNIDEINVALKYVREHSILSGISFKAFQGIDEYLTTAVMLIEEILKNKRRD